MIELSLHAKYSYWVINLNLPYNWNTSLDNVTMIAHNVYIDIRIVQHIFPFL